MIRLLAGEDLDNDILRGLCARIPDLDILRGQDLFEGAPDPSVLDWCAHEGRILLSQDFRTMQKHAYARIRAGLPMPGVFLVPRSAPMGIVIDDLVTLIEASREGEWERQIVFLPL